MIQHVCPECEQAVSLPDELAGHTIRCPSCQSLLQVPSSAITPEPVPPPVPLWEPAVPPEPPALSKNVDLTSGHKKPRDPVNTIAFLYGLPVVICGVAWLFAGGTFGWWRAASSRSSRSSWSCSPGDSAGCWDARRRR